MSKPNYSTIIIAAAWLAMFSVANCNLLAFVRQACFTLEDNDGLTCSIRSPRTGRPILSGATVLTNCLGVTNTTTTDSTGKFNLVINFSTPTEVRNIRRCDLLITLPANCTIFDYGSRIAFLVNDDNPDFQSIDNTVTGGSALFEVEDFEKP